MAAQSGMAPSGGPAQPERRSRSTAGRHACHLSPGLELRPLRRVAHRGADASDRDRSRRWHAHVRRRRWRPAAALLPRSRAPAWRRTARGPRLEQVRAALPRPFHRRRGHYLVRHRRRELRGIGLLGRGRQPRARRPRPVQPGRPRPVRRRSQPDRSHRQHVRVLAVRDRCGNVPRGCRHDARRRTRALACRGGNPRHRRRQVPVRPAHAPPAPRGCRRDSHRARPFGLDCAAVQPSIST